MHEAFFKNSPRRFVWLCFGPKEDFPQMRQSSIFGPMCVCVSIVHMPVSVCVCIWQITARNSAPSVRKTLPTRRRQIVRKMFPNSVRHLFIFRSWRALQPDSTRPTGLCYGSFYQPAGRRMAAMVTLTWNTPRANTTKLHFA